MQLKRERVLQVRGRLTKCDRESSGTAQTFEPAFGVNLVREGRKCARFLIPSTSSERFLAWSPKSARIRMDLRSHFRVASPQTHNGSRRFVDLAVRKSQWGAAAHRTADYVAPARAWSAWLKSAVPIAAPTATAGAAGAAGGGAQGGGA